MQMKQSGFGVHSKENLGLAAEKLCRLSRERIIRYSAPQ